MEPRQHGKRCCEVEITDTNRAGRALCAYVTEMSGDDSTPRVQPTFVSHFILCMDEGTKAKRTVYVGGLGEEIDQKAIFDSFSTFGT